MNLNSNIVYIDESGILSQTGHSVYVCLYVKYLDDYIISQKILDIEKNLNIPYSHWVDMSWRIRIRFAMKIKDLDFTCKIFVYINPINQKDILKDFIVNVIKFEEDVFKIIIDGRQGKKYEKELKLYLKNKGIKVYKIKFKNDKNEPLIRLSDFIVGLYRSYLDNKNDNNSYIYNLLKHKIKIPD